MGSSLSVVISTYEWPEALDAVLRGLADQSDADFEVVVADDGSGAATAAVVRRWQHVLGGDRVVHAWQPDRGYRLARARNLGTLSSSGAYLIFLDGDCIPRPHFVRALKRCGQPGWFVAGRRVWLSPELTGRVLAGRAAVHRWPLVWWLVGARRHATGLGSLTPRDRRRVGNVGVPVFEPHERAYGPGLGVARVDFERVNGYDMRYVGWGEEDVDFAVRLQRSGLRCGHAGPQATLLHLWHPSRMPHERPNWELLEETRAGERVEAVLGLRELAAERAGDESDPRRRAATEGAVQPGRVASVE